VTVGIPVAFLAQNAVYLVYIRVKQLGLADAGIHAHAVKRLLILAPTDIADEALVFDQNALAATDCGKCR
jgi:hypothetical protein